MTPEHYAEQEAQAAKQRKLERKRMMKLEAEEVKADAKAEKQVGLGYRLVRVSPDKTNLVIIPKHKIN